MSLPQELLCVFSAEVEQQGDSYVLEIPKREIEVGDVEPNETYRAALIPTVSSDTASQPRKQEQESRRPPVKEGETRTVEIEDLGERGDGIARVERGYVIIVPETEPGDRASIEVFDVQENVAFAEVIEHQDDS